MASLKEFQKKRGFRETPKLLETAKKKGGDQGGDGTRAVASTSVERQDENKSASRGGPKSRPKLEMPQTARRTEMPDFVRPALATLAEEPFSDPDWLFELKWDGARTLARIRNGETQLWSRSKRNTTREYPELSTLAGSVEAREAWLDGEIVALDEDGRSDFQRLQARFSVKSPSRDLLERVPVVYYVFDLLYLDGYDLRQTTLIERKELLKKILRTDTRVRYSDHQMENGKELFELAMERNLEGIVGKQTASAYPEGRTTAWLKFKAHKDVDAVIGGWTDPRGSREHFGALLLGLYENHKLRFIGGVGSGFTRKLQKLIWPRLQESKSDACPFEVAPTTREQAYWMKPKLVARVEFSGWTEGRHLRQPRFQGLQEDRTPEECTFEKGMKNAVTKQEAKSKGNPVAKKTRMKPAGAELSRENADGAKRPHSARFSGAVELGDESQLSQELENGSRQEILAELDGRQIHLTNLNKVYFPEDRYTKRDLLAYYFRIAPLLLPFLKDRPLVLRRYPNGIDGASFFQKEAGKGVPEWVKTVPVKSESRGSEIRYFLANDRATLLYLTNLGCIDENPWSSRYNDLSHPDYIYFDLDPTKGTPFESVLKLARILMNVLGKLGLKAFAKTSGATGFHIYLPVEPQYKFEQARGFVEAIAKGVTAKYPKLLTAARTVRERARGTVYIDAHQNSQAQSLAAVYSVRAFPHAPVSTPVLAKELVPGLLPEKWNLKTIPRRIERVGDLWADFWKSRQKLETVLQHADVTL